MRKTSIFAWFGYKLDINERFRLIKQSGFDGVMLWWGDEHIDTDGSKEKQPELVFKSNLFIENVHLPYMNSNDLWINNINGDEYADSIIKSVNQCPSFQIPTVVVHLTKGGDPPPISEIGLNRLKRIVEAAERLGINVALENLRKPEYMDYAFKEISSSRLGFCYDSGHNKCFTPQRDFLKQYGNRLFTMHLHDNDGIDDLHMLPFDGISEWDKIKNQLDNIGYNGAISLEVEQGRHEKYRDIPAEEFLSMALLKAKKLI